MEPHDDVQAQPREPAPQEAPELKPRFRVIKLEESVAPGQGVAPAPTHGNGCSKHCCGRCGRCRCGR